MSDVVPLDDDRLLSVAEFCQRNCIKVTKCYELLGLGLLEGLKIGSKTVISPRAEAAWRANLPKFTVRRPGRPHKDANAGATA